jgi:hypothetical protein
MTPVLALHAAFGNQRLKHGAMHLPRTTAVKDRSPVIGGKNVVAWQPGSDGRKVKWTFIDSEMGDGYSLLLRS